MIGTQEDYTPQYPEVLKLTEQDMVIGKTVPTRYVKHPNQAHREVLTALIGKIKRKLEIEPQEGPVQFLKTLLNDDVFMTR